MPMGRVGNYYAEFLQPRILSGMGDLFEFKFLPKLSGLYRRDYTKHMQLDHDHTKDTEYHGVLLSHALVLDLIPFLH